MSSKPTDELFDHVYDGIQEYDNPIPAWVNWILIGTIVYSVFHVLYVEFGPGQTVAEEYAAVMQEYEEKMATQDPEEALALNESTLSLLMSQDAQLQAGAKAFQTYCVACHAEKGQGQIGPNLTDDFWIHGDGSLMAIRKVITEGVLEKGMPSWSVQLSPEQLSQVAAYVGTLRSTNVPGKAPEGEYKESAAATNEAEDEDETASL